MMEKCRWRPLFISRLVVAAAAIASSFKERSDKNFKFAMKENIHALLTEGFGNTILILALKIYKRHNKLMLLNSVAARRQLSNLASSPTRKLTI